MIDGIRPEDSVVVTTANFRLGQRAAWRDFGIDPDSTPNEELKTRLGSEFWAGYVSEWNDFCVPARARMGDLDS
jgi:hypothetical protein